jgi:hypothetical protein
MLPPEPDVKKAWKEESQILSLTIDKDSSGISSHALHRASASHLSSERTALWSLQRYPCQKLLYLYRLIDIDDYEFYGFRRVLRYPKCTSSQGTGRFLPSLTHQPNQERSMSVSES